MGEPVWSAFRTLHQARLARRRRQHPAQIEASARITQPCSMDGHWRDPRPRLAVAGDRIALTDPLEGLVRLVDPASLAGTVTIPVEGLPYNILAVATAA